MVIVLAEIHRVVKKNFETELFVDGKKLPLNHMMQETLGNVVAGFAKTLKGASDDVERVEVKTKRLHQPIEVDAHKYP